MLQGICRKSKPDIDVVPILPYFSQSPLAGEIGEKIESSPPSHFTKNSYNLTLSRLSKIVKQLAET